MGQRSESTEQKAHFRLTKNPTGNTLVVLTMVYMFSVLSTFELAVVDVCVVIPGDGSC